MEDINIEIFVVIMLAIGYYYQPQSTLKIISLPIIGLYVVLEVISEIASLILFGKQEKK